MKNIIVVLVFIGLVGCRALDRLTMFDLKYDTSFTVPKTSLVGLPVDVASPEVATNTEEQFAIHDTRKDLIEEIKLKKLTLQIENEGYTFSFLKSVEVFIRAEGLHEVKIAEKSFVPDEIGNQLEMDVVNVDLSEYLKKDKISLRVKTVNDKPLTEDLRVKLKSVFRVDAKILGI